MSELPALPAPGEDLERFITQITPPGAMTWRALPLELPWTRPPGNGRRPPTEEEKRTRLREAGVSAGAQSYVLYGPLTEATRESPRVAVRNLGLPARSIEVAVEHDIVGGDLRDLADRLSLSDHRVPIQRSEAVMEGDPRGARRYLSRGRRLLRDLGVWPWAHVDEWRARRPWYRQRVVLVELVKWHDRAWIAAAERLASAARARRGAPSFGAITVEELEACRRFQRELLGMKTSLREPRSGAS